MKIIPSIYFLLFVFSFSSITQAQKMSREEYINKYKDLAIEQMVEYKIPASITLAQGILESGNGNSRLAKKGNNHFGIKCHSDWRGKRIKEDDDAKNECFRKYKSVEDSYDDHSYFLSQRDRYSFLFSYDIADYKAWSKGLKKAGYATNPKYPQLLIKIIEENKLYQYDEQGLLAMNGEKPKPIKLEDIMAYAPPSEEDFEAIEIGDNGRNIYENNGVKFILSKEGDDFGIIATDFNIYKWQIWTYNDMKRKDNLTSGQIVYIQKKKSKAKQKLHTIKEGETLHYISQLHAIKLKKLYKRNKLKEGDNIKPGMKLKLR